jgi:hypothetical protein
LAHVLARLTRGFFVVCFKKEVTGKEELSVTIFDVNLGRLPAKIDEFGYDMSRFVFD